MNNTKVVTRIAPLICINNYEKEPNNRVSLTIGKLYEASLNYVYHFGNYYQIINENKIIYNFPEKELSKYFITIAEYRNNQIDSILE